MAAIDCSKLREPTPQRVQDACELFNRENVEIEQALKELFTQYPGNSDPRHVLLKVVALNSLYSTQITAHSQKIPNVVDLAQHICAKAHDIDSALAIGSPGIVETIAGIRVAGKKDRIYFSFATKYCSWHKPELYPMWDANVQRYIGCLQEQSDFAKGFDVNADHWTYEGFRGAMKAFRECYRLGSFTFKDIDKFLWLEGGR